MSQGEPMDPYQPPAESDDVEERVSQTLPKFLSYYYFLVGVLSITSVVLTIPGGNRFKFDPTFLIWLALGWGLGLKSPTARMGAIIIFWIVLIVSGLTMLSGKGLVRLGNFSFEPADPWFFWAQGMALIIVGVPAVILMSPPGRQAYEIPRQQS